MKIFDFEILVFILWLCYYNLVNHSFLYDVRQHFFPRIVNIWNSLPNSIVNAFKVRLDKFWSLAVKYDFTAHLTETVNRSEEVIKSQSFH